MNTLKGPVSLSIGIGLLSAATSWAVWKYYFKREKIPEKWRTVGKLVDMMCFPIKSAGVIRLDEMECTDLGLQSGLLRDRCFMIVTLKGSFVTARTHPKLVLIQPKVEGDYLVLEAPDMEILKLNLKTGLDKKTTVSLWGTTLKCLDSGDEAAKWISRYALGKDSGFRLVNCPDNYKKMQKSRKTMITNFDSGAFTDLTSYHLINGGSMDELNSRMSSPIEAQQFRPNFVVSGGKPYEEDYWEWVKIGDVVFRVLKQCNRCTLTLVNPETGVKDIETREPLQTLDQYRKVGDPKLKVSDMTTPVLGIHLGLRQGGFVKIGDTVEVA